MTRELLKTKVMPISGIKKKNLMTIKQDISYPKNKLVDLVSGSQYMITGTGNMKLKDIDVTTNWTLQVTFGNNGIGYSQGNGSVYLDNKEVTSYTMSSITKLNSSNIASSCGISRICSSSSYYNPEISSLSGGTAH